MFRASNRPTEDGEQGPPWRERAGVRGGWRKSPLKAPMFRASNRPTEDGEQGPPWRERAGFRAIRSAAFPREYLSEDGSGAHVHALVEQPILGGKSGSCFSPQAQPARLPPSTTIAAPVITAAAGLARNATTSAISSG